MSLPGWGWSPMWSLVVPCGWWWGGAAAVSTVALVSVCACLCEYVHTFACMCAHSMCVVYACVSVCGSCEMCVSVFILLGH